MTEATQMQRLEEILEGCNQLSVSNLWQVESLLLILPRLGSGTLTPLQQFLSGLDTHNLNGEIFLIPSFQENVSSEPRVNNYIVYRGPPKDFGNPRLTANGWLAAETAARAYKSVNYNVLIVPSRLVDMPSEFTEFQYKLYFIEKK